MSRPHLELADVFKAFDSDYSKTDTQSLSYEQRRVLRDIIQCRSAALGGHVEQCTQCSHQQIAYNSCRNRHCPKCQAAARKEWTQQRAAELLPVEYFHVVFTLPDQLSALALQNKRVIYGLLFRAASQTLLEIAADPKRLGAAIGFLAVLHRFNTIRTCIASYLAVDYHLTSHDGSVAGKDSFSQSRYSVDSSAVSFSLILGRQTSTAVWSFTANRNIWQKTITLRVC